MDRFKSHRLGYNEHMLHFGGFPEPEPTRLEGLMSPEWQVLTPTEAGRWRAEEERWASTEMHDALHKSAEAGDTRTMVRLLAGGIEVDRQNGPNQLNAVSPLMVAAKYGRTAALELLIRAGADVNAQANGGWTALHLGAVAGQYKVVALLLAKGADRDITNEGGGKPLDFAAGVECNALLQVQQPPASAASVWWSSQLGALR